MIKLSTICHFSLVSPKTTNLNPNYLYLLFSDSDFISPFVSTNKIIYECVNGDKANKSPIRCLIRVDYHIKPLRIKRTIRNTL